MLPLPWRKLVLSLAEGRVGERGNVPLVNGIGTTGGRRMLLSCFWQYCRHWHDSCSIENGR